MNVYEEILYKWQCYPNPPLYLPIVQKSRYHCFVDSCSKECSLGIGAKKCGISFCELMERENKKKEKNLKK